MSPDFGYYLAWICCARYAQDSVLFRYSLSSSRFAINRIEIMMNPAKLMGFAFRAFLMLSCLSISAPAFAMNCYKAKTNIEHMICDEKRYPDLILLDSELNALYKEAAANSKSDTYKELIDTQRKWITKDRNSCTDASCVRNSYQSRIEELKKIATLCRSSESIMFSCGLPGGKIASLCVSQDTGPNVGYMQYRIGRNHDDLEMEFPSQQTPARNYFKHMGDGMGGVRGVSFWLGNQRYSVFQNQSRLDEYNQAGIIVSRGRPPVRVSYTQCLREPIAFSARKNGQMNLTNLGKSLALPEAREDISYAAGEDDVAPGERERGN
jgi:uncharacterized protein